MFNSNAMTPADYAAITKNDDSAWGGGNGVWWIILLVLLFGGWGRGGYGYGADPSFQGTTSVYEGYVLNNDMSMLQRAISDSTNMLERRTDNIINGICTLGYDSLAQTNSINTNVMQGINTLQAAVKDCCCQTQQNIGDVKYAIGSTGADISRGVERGFSDTNYNMSTLANGINTAVANGFCQTNFNAQTNTRDIVDSQNAGTQAILARIDAMESSRKDEKIAELQAINSDLRLAASQAAQNTYLVDKLGYKQPVPAFSVPAPWYTTCGCSCNSGCGC